MIPDKEPKKVAKYIYLLFFCFSLLIFRNPDQIYKSFYNLNNYLILNSNLKNNGLNCLGEGSQDKELIDSQLILNTSYSANRVDIVNYLLGCQYFQNNQPQLAIESWEKSRLLISQKFANETLRYFDSDKSLGLTYSDYAEALDNRPDEKKGRYYVKLCVYYLDQSQQEEASYWCNLLNQVSNGPYGLLLLGRAKMLTSDFEGAKTLVEEALIIDENIPEAYHLIAKLKLEENLLEEAESAIKIGIEKDPNNGFFQITYTSILIRNGEHDQAVELSENILSQFSRNQEIIISLCNLLEENNLHKDTCREN
ncbi:MAG: hypothetical protein QNJ45_07285 [Ardenticatenaceae bacterium]|nr:hypothetical protein [Ardenticatenaceae bacterium]